MITKIIELCELEQGYDLGYSEVVYYWHFIAESMFM